ncbi:hypothetical protein J6590_018553 [Homalodisca vitripennis]|nr:hypothetical protein J6590_018553 [Homalodisca vitripennis]
MASLWRDVAKNPEINLSKVLSGSLRVQDSQNVGFYTSHIKIQQQQNVWPKAGRNKDLTDLCVSRVTISARPEPGAESVIVAAN